MKGTALEAARKAGELLMKHHGSLTHDVKVKEGTSLVSALDLESERIIIKEIKKRFPDHNIISEESRPENNKSDYTWYIDPIDGTSNYVKGLDLFGISIAAAYKGEVQLGVIYMPATNKLYVAEKGKGSVLCKGFNDEGKPIKVSSAESLKHSMVVLDSSFAGRPREMKLRKNLEKIVFSDRMFGSAVYTLTNIAEGRVDASYVYSTKPWDVAAGFILIEEAGGRITLPDGNPWRITKKDFVASNGKLHAELLKYTL